MILESICKYKIRSRFLYLHGRNSRPDFSSSRLSIRKMKDFVKSVRVVRNLFISVKGNCMISLK